MRHAVICTRLPKKGNTCPEVGNGGVPLGSAVHTLDPRHIVGMGGADQFLGTWAGTGVSSTLTLWHFATLCLETIHMWGIRAPYVSAGGHLCQRGDGGTPRLAWLLHLHTLCRMQHVCRWPG